MFVKSENVILRENLSANFALKARLAAGPISVCDDVTRVLELAVERFVALSTVERLGATLEMQLGVVALEGGLALQVDVAVVAEERVRPRTVLFGHVTLVRYAILNKNKTISNNI